MLQSTLMLLEMVWAWLSYWRVSECWSVDSQQNQSSAVCSVGSLLCQWRYASGNHGTLLITVYNVEQLVLTASELRLQEL